ncbi:hypothetical protein IMSAG013_01393 [Clostridiales bacterium]|nr:hypothetical protein IMSAG013_01393 [Clostridiales bacterium]
MILPICSSSKMIVETIPQSAALTAPFAGGSLFMWVLYSSLDLFYIFILIRSQFFYTPDFIFFEKLLYCRQNCDILNLYAYAESLYDKQAVKRTAAQLCCIQVFIWKGF